MKFVFVDFIENSKVKSWGLRSFQEYFTSIEPKINERWKKTGVPGEKPPDLPVQNLASHMYPSEARTTAVRDSIFKGMRKVSQKLVPLHNDLMTLLCNYPCNMGYFL